MYTWIAETFGIGDGIARGLAFAIALGIVLILIALFTMILKRLTGTRLSSGRSRQPRITVMDATNVDARRRLLLIRRDNVEHLILIGGPTDIVIEQNIIKSAPLGSTNGRSQIAPSGYTVPPQAETIAEPMAVSAEQAPRPAPVMPAPVAATPAPPSPVEPAAQAPKQVSSDNAQPRSSLNPARSLLQAAASGRITPPSLTKTDSPSSSVSGRSDPANGGQAARPQASAPSQQAQMARGLPAGPQPPRQAERPQTGAGVTQSRAPSVSIDSTARPDAQTRTSGQPATLSSYLAAARPNALSSHQVSPPSSGPAARALTAVQRSANGSATAPVATSAAPTVKPEPKQEPRQDLDATVPVPAAAQTADLTKETASVAGNVSPETAAPSAAPGKPEADEASSDKATTPPSSSAQEGTGAHLDVVPEKVGDADAAEVKKQTKDGVNELPNPIEDEMAKLLDEIHGPQKQ
ncbi:hypothetical protein [Roseibium sp.]|uniref:hypothetical protein n=1 Tax=Roseibium sp. TaxID=1936156 RepID=UPI003A97FCA3